MSTSQIPEDSASALVKSFVIVLQQVTMYGLNHNVAQLAIKDAFSRLETALTMHGALEISAHLNELSVNDTQLSTRDSFATTFAKRLQQHQINGIRFLPAIDTTEFTIFIQLFTMPPNAISLQGGTQKLFENAGLRYIKLVNTEYQKVSDSKHPTLSIPKSSEKPMPINSGHVTGTFSLSDALPTSPSPFHAAASQPSALKKHRMENAKKMADLLHATATLLENSGTLPPEIEQQQILSVIDRILKQLEASSAETQKQITHIAGQVDADRQTIASIESAARRRGIGFNLTRKELLEQYAEINQEILQPVTVSTGALDILLSGQCGELSQSQKNLLKLAFEGMERVNQLIAYTNRISGLPESLHPNDAMIRDSYTNPPTP